ncbi:hypothetical protein ACVW1C_006067 [Bradyrhizobium sp. USDA 4011]
MATVTAGAPGAVSATTRSFSAVVPLGRATAAPLSLRVSLRIVKRVAAATRGKISSDISILCGGRALIRDAKRTGSGNRKFERTEDILVIASARCNLFDGHAGQHTDLYYCC